MARLNVKPNPYHSGLVTHEGAPAKVITPEQALRRSVLACFLWEDQFYEDGVSIAKRIEELSKQVSPEFLASLAIEARKQHNLRHAPLWLLTHLIANARGNSIVANTIEQVVSRVDEMPELLEMYWQNRDGQKKKIAAQLKKGLARAFLKFDAYQLAKYNRDNAVKLRDVMFLVHPEPRNETQAEIWKKLVDKTLESPDTWEVSLSAGADKKETFTRLLQENKLGYLALLRNLRNMEQSGVDQSLVRDAILARKGANKVLPFRYIAAARAAPQFEPYLDQALSEAVSESPVFDGETAILVDISPSMNVKLSAKSDLTRVDAAATLASIIHGKRRVFSFSNNTVEVPPRFGMAGVDAIKNSQLTSGTFLGAAVRYVNERVKHDRLIVITDEQSHDPVPDPICKKAYMINMASHQNGVGYRGNWKVHITGFSESVLKYISAIESESTNDR